MSAWWYHLWNDPVRHNPWSLAALVVIVIALLAGLAMMETMMFRRRRKETNNMEPTDTTPPSGSMDPNATAADTDPRWVRSADDRQEADRETAASAIAGAREGSASRLAVWTPEMDQLADLPPISRRRDREPVSDDTAVQEAKWAAEGIPARPARLSARALVPRTVVNQHREPCEHCGGSGYMPAISDYLRESIAIVAPTGDEVIRNFYAALFRAAPDLVRLFPGDPTQGDLGTDHKGARQRELLLGALVALSDLYDPDDPDRMERLDTALASFGRKHAAFARPDGTIQGATLDEYKAVKDALFATLVQAAGPAWKPEYTASWSEAYDYAASVMLAEQFRSGFNSPRFPRT